MLPLKITTTTEGISLSSTSHCIYLIKNYHNEADCDKGADAVKNFLYFEVNDTNPLNALEFIREDGKLFFDYVVLLQQILTGMQKRAEYMYTTTRMFNFY